MRDWLGLGFAHEISSGDSTCNETDRLPAVELILFDPDSGSGFTRGSALGPDLLAGIGKTPTDPRDTNRVGLAHSAFILARVYVQRVVAAILDAPAPLFEVQPFGVTQVAEGP
jgi:hypothetical protein